MPGQFVYECPVLLPTLKRAEKLVPPEFVPCYDWFISNVGMTSSALPHRMKPRPNTPTSLSRDSGIHSPSPDRIKYVNGRRYALSVHTSKAKGIRRYSDREPIWLEDGTWIFDYAAYDGEDRGQCYNSSLINCLVDGIPVGVIDVDRNGRDYRVLGLAFVERYNSATRMFTLHGPVTRDSESQGLFAAPGLDELPEDERRIVIDYDGLDDRRIVEVRQIRREQQGRFRNELLNAYNGTCAISGTDVPEVLQAAHINPYRGKKSQIVNNGILLRADLHLLFDALLVSIEPDTLSVSLSDRLSNTIYHQYINRRLAIPTQSALAPSRELLAVHYRQFKRENRILAS